MEIEVRCMDLAVDSQNSQVKIGQYGAFGNGYKDQYYIPVRGFDVGNNNLPSQLKQQMASNQQYRPTHGKDYYNHRSDDQSTPRNGTTHSGQHERSGVSAGVEIDY